MQDNRDRLRSGLWLSNTTAFPAKYTGTCILCSSAIAVGENQRNISRYPAGHIAERGWCHDSCAVDEGIPTFVKKPGSGR